LIQVKHFHILSLSKWPSLPLVFEKLWASEQSSNKSFTAFSFSLFFALLNFSTDSVDVKIISHELIKFFFVAILQSPRFNSSHSVFPIANKYFPLKQSFCNESLIWSNLKFKLLNPSISGQKYLSLSFPGTELKICLPSSITLSRLSILANGLPSFSN